MIKIFLMKPCRVMKEKEKKHQHKKSDPGTDSDLPPGESRGVLCR